MIPRMPEFKKHLDSALRKNDFWTCLVQSHELDLMIIVGLVQLRVFYDGLNN